MYIYMCVHAYMHVYSPDGLSLHVGREGDVCVSVSVFVAGAFWAKP